MVLPGDWDVQREQRILSAIRNSLLADPRIARLGERPHKDGKLIERNAMVEAKE